MDRAGCECGNGGRTVRAPLSVADSLIHWAKMPQRVTCHNHAAPLMQGVVGPTDAEVPRDTGNRLAEQPSGTKV